MTTTSATSATSSIITALGAGSGIDMAKLATDLAAAQYATRIDRLAAKSERLEAQISAASEIKSMMLSLASSLGDRVRMGDLSAQPSVDDAGVAGTALSGTSRPAGTFSLEVEQLARGQMLASGSFASRSAVVGSGTITVRFGTVAAGSFAEGTKPAVDIAIPAGATLAQTAQAITASGAGLTAYVSDTVDGARLVIKGPDGTASGFVLNVAEDAADPGLAALAWQPGAASGTLLQDAQDARLKIDGLARTAPSNTLTDAIPGVVLTLSGTNAGAPTKVRFADPGSAITGAMQDLTGVLNEIAGVLNAATNPLGGDLARDSGARALRQSFSALASRVVMPGAADGEPRTLSDLGLKITRYGTFELDTDRLADTLKRDPEGVAAMFTTGVTGVYATFDSLSRSVGSVGRPGSLGGSLSRFTEELAQLGKDQAILAEDQEETRARLAARFAVSDSRIMGYQSTLSFLENQIAAWNADKG